MSRLSKIIRFWGVCDLGFIVWYLGYSVFNFQIPIYHEIVSSAKTAASFEHPVPLYITLVALILLISFVVSGWLLYKENSRGAIIAYVQTPFRLVLYKPSIFFIHMPLKYLFVKPPMAFGVALLLFSEVLKISTVVPWHRRIRKDI